MVQANQLKVISQMAVGFDNIDIQSATSHHIAVGNTPGVLTETTADFTWALLMALARQVVTSNNEVHQGIWRPWGPEVFAGADVFGKTLGIIGFGRIGQAVARRAAWFWYEVSWFSLEMPKIKPCDQELNFATSIIYCSNRILSVCMPILIRLHGG